VHDLCAAGQNRAHAYQGHYKSARDQEHSPSPELRYCYPSDLLIVKIVDSAGRFAGGPALIAKLPRRVYATARSGGLDITTT